MHFFFFFKSFDDNIQVGARNKRRRCIGNVDWADELKPQI